MLAVIEPLEDNAETQFLPASLFPVENNCTCSSSRDIFFCFIDRMKTLNCYVLLLCWKAICCNSCQLTNITIAVEREECEFCITVNATWCSGYCFTRVRLLISGTRIKYFKWCMDNPSLQSVANTWTGWTLWKNRLNNCCAIWHRSGYTANLKHRQKGEIL